MEVQLILTTALNVLTKLSILVTISEGRPIKKLASICFATAGSELSAVKNPSVKTIAADLSLVRK